MNAALLRVTVGVVLGGVQCAHGGESHCSAFLHDDGIKNAQSRVVERSAGYNTNRNSICGWRGTNKPSCRFGRCWNACLRTLVVTENITTALSSRHLWLYISLLQVLDLVSKVDVGAAGQETQGPCGYGRGVETIQTATWSLYL